MSITEKPKILIVDDLEVNLILLETILRKEQAEIHKALNGPAALELSEIHDYALIILDVSIPGMNGYEIAQRLRQQSLNQLTPIIFVTAIHYDDHSITQGYKAGAVDYLTKPYQNEILLSKVRIFLQLSNQNRELVSQRIALTESIEKYRKAEKTILFKYQLERAVSLASARFSGNFDPESSIQFMLMDMARLCNASAGVFICDKCFVQRIEIKGNEFSGSEIPDTSPEILQQLSHQYNQTGNECNVLINKSAEESLWVKPEHNLTDNNIQSTIAIKVNVSELFEGFILLYNCAGIYEWDASDISSLEIFGTITGNALERYLTRKALEQSEIKYRSYIENAPEGILVAESSGIVADANPAAILMFKHISSELKNSDLHQLLKKENLAGSFPDFISLTGNERNLGEFFVTSGKIIKIIRAESVRLPDSNFLIFCTDMTATREMEKHLIYTERMVGIGEMATGIAHEINQPLNIISFGIDNLLYALNNQKADEEYIKEKTRKIFEGIHRMRTIIDHVRTFSRSNDDYIHSAFSVNESIENALSLVSEQFRNHGISLTSKLADEQSVVVQGNTFKIEQVILNLLSNARDTLDDKIKRKTEGYIPSIIVSSQREDKKILISVEDNGNGIDPEHLEHLTTPFFTTKEPGKGTGLGLAISYGILKEHKGEIVFKSEPGNGTTVELHLPVSGSLTNNNTGA